MKAAGRVSFSIMACLALVLIVTASAAAESDSWREDITRQIAEEEYHFSARTDGSWSAPNRAHRLRSVVDDSGIRIEDRVAGDQEWQWGWQLAWWGRGAERITPDQPVLHVDGARAELLGNGLDEWYINREDGLEQGFTVHQRPAGDGPMVVSGRMSGNFRVTMHSDRRGIDLRTPAGVTVLHYSHLAAFDALDEALACRLEVDGFELRLVVVDHDAVYPITIDPLLSSASWTADGTQGSAAFGATVATAGDIDGDGYADILIGASDFDNGQSNEGRVYLYRGSA
ncbi:MAG: integrin alpha, partial [Thermoanaerobaculales bacterium]|nr:integrin alpha [Thermoanaerobaculales bacterium]